MKISGSPSSNKAPKRWQRLKFRSLITSTTNWLLRSAAVKTQSACNKGTKEKRVRTKPAQTSRLKMCSDLGNKISHRRDSCAQSLCYSRRVHAKFLREAWLRVSLPAIKFPFKPWTKRKRSGRIKWTRNLATVWWSRQTHLATSRWSSTRRRDVLLRAHRFKINWRTKPWKLLRPCPPQT